MQERARDRERVREEGESKGTEKMGEREVKRGRQTGAKRTVQAVDSLTAA